MAITSTNMSTLSLFLLLLASAAAARRPCYNGTFYFHDILYNGHNLDNYTSAIVGSPSWGNKTTLAKPNNFGNLAIFDDPITLDNDLHSTPVGRARGFYLYDDKETFGSWVGFSFALNYTGGKGTINFAGADPLMEKSRDISVIGGTGDFLMARGMATLRTDAYEGDVYFRLSVEIKLYECRGYWVN